MIIKLRVAQNRAAMEIIGRVFEWQPLQSSNGKWYHIRKENVSFNPNNTIENQQFIGQFFVALRYDLSVVVHGKYFRHEKKLILNVEKL